MSDRINFMLQPNPGSSEIQAETWRFELGGAATGPWRLTVPRSVREVSWSECGYLNPPVEHTELNSRCFEVWVDSPVDNEFLRGFAVGTLEGLEVVSAPSNVIALPETSLPAALILGAVVVALLGMFRGQPKGPRGPLP